MPRNPAAKKNQHNNRHENGLVGPGKRVTKQKSNGHLNGSVKPAIPDEPLPVTSSPDLQPTHAYQSNSSSAGASRFESQPSLSKRNSDSSVDGHEQKWENANGSAGTNSRRPDMAQARNKLSSDVSAFQIASTILRSCPAADTVALLIVLLALPSMVLTIVQALFASLTLMPPTNLSPVSFLSLFDVFQGSAGSPSLGTMAVVDVICFGLWICLWNWAQHFALDLAQIQIAMTLGNGNSGKSGSVNMFCFAIVLVLHSVRSRGVRRFFVSNLIPSALLTHPKLLELGQYFPSENDFGEIPGIPSKIRSLFAIHILSQALMAFVRRRVASTQAGSASRTTRRNDTEAYAGSSNVSEPSNPDSSTATSTSVDFQSPATPGVKDPKDKALSAKKRRRQANQVRSRQPFWAALASTKVHVLREVEHKNDHLRKAAEVQSSNSQDLVWISNVEPSSIEFGATISSFDRDHESTHSQDPKPFFIRINGARWHSVALESVEEGEPYQSQWLGTISGLIPDCTYTCSFIRDDDEEFASIMVKTPALQDRDLQSLAPAPPRASLRPHSPTSTLKNSIQTAEAKLTEARARVTKARRTHRGAVQRIEKEVDSFNGRLKSSSDDTRQQQKLLQAERSIQQTKAAIEDITVQLSDLEAIPEDEVVDYEQRKGIFDERSKLLASANEALAHSRSEAKNELSCIQNELNTINSRKERLQGRQGKLAEQHDRITQANAQGMNEKERKAHESARMEAERHRRETELNEGVRHMINELRDLQMRTQSQWQELEAAEKLAYAQRESMLNNGGPLTPEGNLPGTNPQQGRTFMYGPYQPSGLGYVENQASPFLAYAKTLPSDTRRPRSSTNRSLGAISNFSADAFEDADPIPPMPSTIDYDASGLNGRKGSGSSRGQNNGSPAGVIGENIRSSQKESNSPGHMPGANTW